MNRPKVKALAVIFVLFLLIGIVSAGCGKQKNAWVNTNSMPGHAFTNTTPSARHSNSRIVYLGSSSNSHYSNFGPRDVDFHFENLK